MSGRTIPPSGKRQTTRAAQVLTFEGDKIKESRPYFDMLSLLQQIGASRSEAAYPLNSLRPSRYPLNLLD